MSGENSTARFVVGPTQLDLWGLEVFGTWSRGARVRRECALQATKGQGRSWRKLVVVPVMMLDILRRLFGTNLRRVDIWAIVIDLLILLLILGEDLIKVIVWLRHQRQVKLEEKEAAQKLSGLDPEDAEAVRKFVLEGILPEDRVCVQLERIPLPSLVERDPVKGYRIVEQHRPFLRKWAMRRGGQERER